MKATLIVIIALLVILTIALPGLCFDRWDDGYLWVPSEYPTIQDAIDAAIDGDTVLVYPGTFSGEGNREISFLGKAITVKSAYGAEYTVIDCKHEGRGFLFLTAENVGSLLAGFTITNGHAYRGGGIWCRESSPAITDCIIIGNTAKHDGGGIYCDHSSPTIKNCKITDNPADDYGGGIYCRHSSPTITNCTITGNSILGYWGDGGGIYCWESFPTITNCILWNDTPEEVYIHSGDPCITYSNIQGGWAGYGNIDSDPLFTEPESGDYTLLPGSLCINAGNPYSRLDLDGSTNDMGSFGGMGDMPEGAIGGYIYGTLSISGSPFIVSEDLVIEFQDTLIVEPGVVLKLHNNSGFIVYGALLAEGTEDDSITITRFQEWEMGGGVRFIQGEGTLSFTRIEKCRNVYGGGIYCRDSSPTLTNCTISGNTASNDGGGIYCDYDSSPIITNSSINGNTAGYEGGGLHCLLSSPAITSVTIVGNTAGRDAGGIYCYDSFPTISNCTIDGNTASDDCGGIGCLASSPIITNCKITGNTAASSRSGAGGGLFCYGDSSPTLMNCTISGNTTCWSGGGIYCSGSSPVITNCTIAENTATWFNGGIRCSLNSSPIIMNCTIIGNTAAEFGGIFCSDSSPTIVNCILWNNLPREIYVESGDPIVKYSDIQGGWIGVGNIDADPLFTLIPWFGFDYGLRTSSPCIDSGDPAIEDEIYDWHPLCPDWYVNGARSDMGAYGGPGNIYWIN